MQHPTATWHWKYNMSNPPRLPPPPPSGEHKRRLFRPIIYWGKDAQILFHGWPGTSTGMYVLAISFVFSLAVLVEFFSHLAKFFKPGSNWFASSVFQTGLHPVQSGFAYFVILALPSFNGGVFIAAVLGHVVGYSIFRSGLCFSKDG